jgi:MFS family permease
MSDASAPDINKTRLFVVSIIALTTAGMAFSIRSSTGSVLEQDFLRLADAANSGQLLGSAYGIAFLGFAFTIAIGSPLLDVLGMGRLLLLSSLCFIGGTTLIELLPKPSAAGDMQPYNQLWLGCLVTGIGWGLVETVINPLTATLYPKDKTAKLNILHAWWPGGLIIGGLLGVGIGALDLDWRLKYAALYIPAVVFGIMCLGTRFPKTERAAAGIPTGTMFAQLGRPLFLVFFFCMFLTAAAELAPGQWVDFALSKNVGMPGVIVLVYISAIMFVMRHFAGALAHRLSPVGVMWMSCLLASVGLFLLSKATSPVTAILAATVWGTGVCFMWPTMLAAASERFPKGGALLMGLMGTAGTASIWFFLPRMGAIYDHAKVALAAEQDPGNPATLIFSAIARGIADLLHVGGQAASDATAQAAFAALEAAAKTDPAQQARLDQVLNQAAAISFQSIAVMPALLLLVFGAIWLYDRSRGGYRPEELHT